MKIKIISESNPKLLDSFPEDPYSDIVIISGTSVYRLALAHLIDSHFFEDFQGNLQELDLSHLPEEELGHVLRALYGGQLQATSITELESLYHVITFLEIDDYKDSLAKEIGNRTDLLESIDIMAFCFDSDFLKAQIWNYHLDSDLRVLTNSKNYLRLNKIKSKALNSLLIEYYQRVGDRSDQVINHILENYFCRNSIIALDYFQDPELFPLVQIWEKHHHKIIIKEFVRYKSTGQLNMENRFKLSQLQTVPSVQRLTPVSSEHQSSAPETAETVSLSESLLLKIQELKKTVSDPKLSPTRKDSNLLRIPQPKNQVNIVSEYQKRSCIIDHISESDESEDADDPVKQIYGTVSQQITRGDIKRSKNLHIGIKKEKEQLSLSEQVMADLQKFQWKFSVKGKNNI